MNSFTQGSSGGDVLFVELTKRWKGVEHTVCTSALGEHFCRMKGMTNAHFVISTEEKEFRGVITTYILRILIGFKIAINLRFIPDIIYVSSDILCDIFPACVLKIRAKIAGKNCKWVQKFYHINNPNRKLSYATQLFSLALIRRFADVFVGCSQESVDLLKIRGFPESILHFVRPGANIVLPTKNKNSEYNAIFLGRIHPSKGVDDILLVWKEVILKKPQAKLALIGRGEENVMSFYQSKIEEFGLSDSIKMLGFVPDNEVSSLLSGTRLLVFPSHEEGYGMAVAEAIAHGCQVVAYDLPVFRNEFGSNLIRVECFDTKVFAKKVIDCMNNDRKINRPDFIRSWEQASSEEFKIIENQFVI